MKKLLIILLCLPMIGFGQTLIPDANFEQALINLGYDTPPINGSVPTANINTVTALYVAVQSISDLTGIEAFTALDSLYCSLNQLTSLDISNNTALTFLNCRNNQLTSLDVSNNTALETLVCYSNQLTILDVSGATALDSLNCGGNQLTSLDVSNNTALTHLNCGGNQLTSLDVSNNTALTDLYCDGNNLTTLNLSGATALTDLFCTYNQLTSLNVSANTALTTLWCIDNQLTSLDVSNNTNLVEFWCSNNPLIALTVKNGNNTNMTCDYVGPKLSCGGLGFISSLSCIEVDDVAWSYTNWVNGPWSVSIDTIFQYFSTNCNPSSIQEHSTNKKLLKITDLLGRETKGKKNEVLFYIYDDGTVEKRIVIE